ncbi:hypothetical protein [Paracoccus yeei]|uniref:Uncharacterized protein n=1 Tax=Paracoccus yeei TaxID=147645 RepID=A0A5P2QTH4_9RHOB|nr:hypothetical protein [Paracoccus yeei]QEU08699.1 hypothetical protein FOB51_12240 [Paracoccus yeei]
MSKNLNTPARTSAQILPFINHRDHAAVAFIEAMSGLKLAYLPPVEPPSEQPQNSPAEIVKFASAAKRENADLPLKNQRHKQTPKGRCLVVPLNPLSTPPSQPLKAPSQHPPHKTPSASTVIPFLTPSKRKPTRWNDLHEAARFRVASEYTERAEGLAVSLNLSIGRESSYLSEDRQTKITRLFQNRLNGELKAAGLSGLPYAFTFELSQDGRLHLHGVLDAHGHDRDAIANALRKAAGEIQGRAKARQVKLDLVHDGAGWASYTNKERKRTSQRLDLERLTIMSQSMSRLAKQYSDEARKARIAA